jgi:flavin-dependent dehydrogenase
MIDVAIIGGGPAGCAAAIACARAGLSTILFEGQEAAARRQADPAEPEESIGPDCVSVLLNLGIDCTASCAPFAGIISGHAVSVFGGIAPTAGFHLRRSWLDQVLCTTIADSGVTVRRPTRVFELERNGQRFVLETSTGRVTARWLVDASGRRSWLSRRLKLQRRNLSPPLIACRDILSADARTGAFARFVPHPIGWTWLAEVTPARTVRTRLSLARNAHLIMGTLASKRMCAHVATWQMTRQLAGPRWFITGEAAAALDPASGSGIAFALRSGLAAGAAIAASISDPAMEALIAASYHGVLTTEFRNSSAALAHQYRSLGIGILEESKTSEGVQHYDNGK